MKYIDYGTMQNDAQRRVLEMQRRAHSAVYFQDAPHDIQPPDRQQTAAQRNEAQSGYRTDSQEGRSSGGNEHAMQRNDTCEAPAEKPCADEAAESEKNELMQMLMRDPEQVLLLTILLLLLSEKADMVIILALVYLIL